MKSPRVALLGRLYLRSDLDQKEQLALKTWRAIAEQDSGTALPALQVAELCRSAAGIGNYWAGRDARPLLLLVFQAGAPGPAPFRPDGQASSCTLPGCR